MKSFLIRLLLPIVLPAVEQVARAALAELTAKVDERLAKLPKPPEA